MFTIVDNTVLLARVSEGQQRLHHQAYHDPLTGLANRALFRERLVIAARRAPAAGPPGRAALRRPGRLQADQRQLRARHRRPAAARDRRTAARLRTAARTWWPGSAATSSRCCSSTAPADAEPIGAPDAGRAARAVPDRRAHRRRSAPASAWCCPSTPTRTCPPTSCCAAPTPRCTPASGAARAPSCGTPGAPTAGRTRTCRTCWPGPCPAIRRRAGFEVYYQPIVRFADGATVAVEALARWTDPVVGPVDPTSSSPSPSAPAWSARSTTSCSTGRAPTRRRWPTSTAARSTCTSTCPRPGSASRGSRTRCSGPWSGTRYRPSRLVVEITETRRIPDLPRAVPGREPAPLVRACGSPWTTSAAATTPWPSCTRCRWTSSSWTPPLTDVDVAPERAGALCRSVLAICAELGVVVVAEGIETVPRAHAMADLGCPFGQGYLFGQPVPVLMLSAPGRPAPAGGRPDQSTPSLLGRLAQACGAVQRAAAGLCVGSARRWSGPPATGGGDSGRAARRGPGGSRSPRTTPGPG